MGSMRIRNLQALSSALASLRTLQPWGFGFLNHVDPLVSASNLLMVGVLMYTTYVWQSRVENEHYSVAYFDRVSAFET